jgi:uncharacterized protein YjbI with pentapeptide repeats
MLAGVNVHDANLTGVDLTGANLTDVSWLDTVCPIVYTSPSHREKSNIQSHYFR